MILTLLLGICTCTEAQAETKNTTQTAVATSDSLPAPSILNTDNMSYTGVVLLMAVFLVVILLTAFSIKAYRKFQLGLLSAVSLSIGIYETVLYLFPGTDSILFGIIFMVGAAFLTQYGPTKLFSMPLAATYPLAMTIAPIMGLHSSFLFFMLKIAAAFSLYMLMMVSKPIFEYVFRVSAHTFLTSCFLELTPLKLLSRALTVNLVGISPLNSLSRLLIFTLIPFYALVVPMITKVLLHLVMGGDGGDSK